MAFPGTRGAKSAPGVCADADKWLGPKAVLPIPGCIPRRAVPPSLPPAEAVLQTSRLSQEDSRQPGWSSALGVRNGPAVLAWHREKSFPASPPRCKADATRVQEEVTTFWRRSIPPSLAPCSPPRRAPSGFGACLAHGVARLLSLHPPPKLLLASRLDLAPHTPPSSWMSAFQVLFPPHRVSPLDYVQLVSCWFISNLFRAFGVTLLSLAAFATPSSLQSSANIINLLFTLAFRSLIKTLNKPGMCHFLSNFL